MNEKICNWKKCGKQTKQLILMITKEPCGRNSNRKQCKLLRSEINNK